MFYRLENNEAVETFDTLPEFHEDLMKTIIETKEVPALRSTWNGSVFVPYVIPAEELIKSKLKELEVAFDNESNADVISGGQTWVGGANSAMLMDGKANASIHRGRPSGTIHSKDHRAHTMNINEMKDIAADIADAYDAAYTKLQAKLLEIETCGNDTACLSNIKWGV